MPSGDRLKCVKNSQVRVIPGWVGGEHLKDKFLRLFHRQIPQRELMSRFFAIICEDTNKTVPQFVNRF